MRLVVNIYEALKSCKDYGVRDQIQRSAVSIPSNIAGGLGRNSNREFIQFLYIAKGSSAELIRQLYISMEVGILESSL
jgi:four helix bundle protein